MQVKNPNIFNTQIANKPADDAKLQENKQIESNQAQKSEQKRAEQPVNEQIGSAFSAPKDFSGVMSNMDELSKVALSKDEAAKANASKQLNEQKDAAVKFDADYLKNQNYDKALRTDSLNQAQYAALLA